MQIELNFTLYIMILKKHYYQKIRIYTYTINMICTLHFISSDSLVKMNFFECYRHQVSLSKRTKDLPPLKYSARKWELPNVGARALEKLHKTYIFTKKWRKFSWLKEERIPPSMDCSEKQKNFWLTTKYLYKIIHTRLCPKLLLPPLKKNIKLRTPKVYYSSNSFILSKSVRKKYNSENVNYSFTFNLYKERTKKYLYTCINLY